MSSTFSASCKIYGDWQCSLYVFFPFELHFYIKRNQSGKSTVVILLFSEPVALGGLLVGALTQSQEVEC